MTIVTTPISKASGLNLNDVLAGLAQPQNFCCNQASLRNSQLLTEAASLLDNRLCISCLIEGSEDITTSLIKKQNTKILHGLILLTLLRLAKCRRHTVHIPHSLTLHTSNSRFLVAI